MDIILLRFFNPLGGTPVPVNLSGLFLIEPASLFKLYGISMRGAFADLGGEAFAKKLERVFKGKHPAKPEFVAELLRKIPLDKAIGDLIQAALSVDEDAKKEVAATGDWGKALFRSRLRPGTP